MKIVAGFDALLTEVDRLSLSLDYHDFSPWHVWTGRRWRFVDACRHCGVQFEPYRLRQTCLGVLGELMLAGEKVPKRWADHFPERVRIARRTMKPKKKGPSHEKRK